MGPDFKTPDAPTAQNYTASAPATQTAQADTQLGAPQTLAQGAALQPDWWTLFGSVSLNGLVDEGLRNSPNIASMRAALRQSQENFNAQYGSTVYPRVDGTLSASRQKVSPGEGFGAELYNTYNVGLTVSYTFDAFGGNKRALENLAAQVDYQQYELQGARLTLAANIVLAAINEASLRKQVEVTQGLVDLQQHQLDILQKQFELGAASQADVSTQLAQVAGVRATLPGLNKSLAQARNQLAVLLGRTPDRETPAITLDDLKLPDTLPVSLPSQLVRQRPDIRAAEALLHASSARVGVATANLYPQITLSATGGYTSYGSSGMSFDDLNVWSLGAKLLQPIFNGGSLQAQKRAAEAGLEQSWAQYQQTVLTAFQNVADSLQAVQQDANELNARVDAAKAAQRSLNFTEARYKLGGSSFTALLIAQVQYQQTQLNLWQASAARLSDSATLFQAVGGGLTADSVSAASASAVAAAPAS
ncbi:efflux transporter outer membrane subunit [Silvimonas sp. JCM 19000]